ncbi:MAG: DUF1549 and DUF1553 domain-containing protein [Gemmataceae bacterium]|nr:DUF1549 and DUF1553 domain-containing protein [Gemmataceae bacterium]
MWQQAKWFAVLAVVAVAVLAATPAAWGQSQAWRSKKEVAALTKRIDEQIAAAQKAAGVQPVPPAQHAAFFRRIHLDLAGMIPTLIDMSDYLGNDDPDKLWDWSERFLDQKAYSKHFAAVWRAHILNAANQQAAPFMPPFELWLKDRLQSNIGYDRIVRELLAPGAEANANMMGFRPGSVTPGVGSPTAFYLASEYKAESLAGSTSRVFLGVKLDCAQCHPHPFAKWTKDEFWQFAAFFVGTQRGNVRFQPDGAVPPVQASTARQITIPGTDKVVKAKFLTGEEPKWKPNEPTRTVLADWMTSPKNPYFAKATVDTVWQYFFGVSLLEPIIEPSDDSPITHPELLNDMAQSLIDHEFDLKFLIRAIVHTQAYQRSSGNHGTVTKDDYVLFTRMPVRGLSPEQLYDSVIEAAIGPKGHEELTYQPNFQFGPRQPAGGRAEFLSKFISEDRRHESQTSILQALFLMNGKFLSEKIRDNSNLDILAHPMSRYATTEARIHALFLMSLSREPRPDEYARLVAFVDAGGPQQYRQKLGDILWALLNSAEFRLNH